MASLQDVRALMAEAPPLARSGRVPEAIAVYERALILAGNPADPRFQGISVPLLFARGQCLRLMDRADEAILVYDGAVRAYSAGRGTGASKRRLGTAMAAIIAKLELLCEADRAVEARGLGAELSQLLGDVAVLDGGEPEVAVDPGVPAASPSNERVLAHAVAKVLGDDKRWAPFEADAQSEPREEMASSATALYAITDPWVTSADDEELSLAARAATGLLRDMADGYAQLAKQWPPEQWSMLILPRRTEAFVEHVRELGVEAWTAEHKRPLTLRATSSGGAPGEQTSQAGVGAGLQTSEERFTPEDFMRFFLTMAYLYELLAVATDSPRGRAGLKSSTLQDLACTQLLMAKKALFMLMREREQEAGAAACCVYVAQQLFVATHSGRAVVPPRARMAMLRRLLRRSGSYEVLVEADAPLPAWLATDD